MARWLASQPLGRGSTLFIALYDHQEEADDPEAGFVMITGQKAHAPFEKADDSLCGWRPLRHSFGSGLIGAVMPAGADEAASGEGSPQLDELSWTRHALAPSAAARFTAWSDRQLSAIGQ